MPDKIDQLFGDLQSRGYAKDKTLKQFRDYMLAPGKQGYENRKTFFQDFQSRGETNLKTYEEFRDLLGLHPTATKKSSQKPAVVQSQSQTLPPGFGSLDTRTAGMSPFEREQYEHSQQQKPIEKTEVEKNFEDVQKAMAGDKEAADRAGITARNQWLRDAYEYKKATGKELRDPLNIPFQAPYVARDEKGEMILNESGQPLVGVTTDEKAVNAYKQTERERARKALDEALKKADKGLESRTLMALDESRKEREENPLSFALSHMSPQSTDVYQQGQERMMNQGISPEALWEAINRDGNIEKLLNDDELVSRGAAVEGMSKEDYIQNVLAPHIAEHYDKYLSEKYDIKGFGDYLTQRALGSVAGTILSGAVTTKGQREQRSAAVQRAHEGQGTYQPGVAGRLAGEVAMFAPDAPILAATGAFGGAAAKAVGGGIVRLGETLGKEGLTTLGRVVTSGSPFLAANVGKATKWGGLAMNRALGGTGLGTFMGTSSALQDLSVGDSSLSSVGKAFLSGFGEGTVTGALLGVTNLGAQTAAGNIAGNSLKAKLGRAGMFGTAFVAENQLFANMDRFREDDFDWVDSSADAFYMQLAGKISSAHGLGESMKGVARLFSGKAYTEKGKTGLSWQSDGFRLDDNERAEIERAFGGTKLEEIAANPENVGKILSDKEAISWKARQKVSGSMGMLEPSRPRTDRILVMDKMIDERAEDNELIETHTFETEDEKQSILQKIREKRDNDDMLSDYGILKGMKVQEPNEVEILGAADDLLEENPNLRREDVEKGGKSYDIVVDRAREKYDIARRVIREFAVDYNMSSEEVEEIMRKDPVERTDEEYDLMSDLASRLHKEAHPKGEFHPSQSRIDGRKIAGAEGTVPPEAADEVAQEVRDADEAYYNYLNSHEKMREAVEEMGDARPDEIYMHIFNDYSGTERDEFLPILADRINAQAKQEGFITKVGENIEDTVQQEVDRYSFKGTVDEAKDTDNIITFTHNGKRYTMLNGQVGTRREPGVIDEATGVTTEGAQKVDPDTSGDLIIALDENNNWVFLKPDANMELGYESKADFSARRSEELGVQNTQTLVEAGVVKPEEEKPADTVAEEKIQSGDNADVEASAQDTGANEASATVPVQAATESPQTVEPQKPTIESITDKDGIKRYENGVTTEDAVVDMITSGDDPIEIADASIAEADEIINKINGKATKTRKDLENRKKNQRIKDYYEGIKNSYEHVDRADGTSVTRIGERTLIEKDGKIIYDSAGKLAPVPPVSEGEESINNVVDNNNEPENGVTLQPKVAKGRTADERRAERIRQLKEQYGEHFNADFSYAETAEELAAMYVGRTRTLDRESLAKELGYKLGLRTGEAWAETLLAKKGEGKSTRRVAHEAWESPENPVISDDGTRKFDDQEIHNALLELFRSAEKKSDIIDYPINRREDAAKKLFEEEKARENDAKALDEKPATLSVEEIERITKELPFEMTTDEEIPDSPITQLEKTARELMSEEGTPNIEVIDSERIPRESWRETLDDEYEAFLTDEEIDQLRDERIKEGVFYNEETGKITVFSGELTPDELRRRVQTIKDYIHDRNSNERRDNDEGTVAEGGEPRLHQEDEGKAPEDRTGEGDAEPERGDEQVDDYEDVYVSYRPSDKVKELEDKAGELSQQHYDKQIEGRVLWSRRRKLERELKGKRGKKREEIEAQLAELDKEIAALDKELERLDEAQTEANEEWEEAEGKELSEHMKKLSDEDLVKLLMEKEGWEQEGNDWYLEDHEYNAAVGELSNRGIDDAKEAEIRKKLEANTGSKPEGVEPHAEPKPAEGKPSGGPEGTVADSKEEYLKPRNDKEKEIISDVEKKLAEDIAEQQKKVNKAKQKWDDETAKVNQRPEAGLFGDEVEERPKKAGDQLEMFEGEEKPALDVSEENLRKQVKEYEDAYRHEQQVLERLKSKAEHDSRIRGALDNERLQTKIDTEGKPSDTVAPSGTGHQPTEEPTKQHFVENADKAPKGIKWSEKTTDKGYTYKHVQLGVDGNDLYIRQSGTYANNPRGKEIIYKIKDYKSHSINDVLLDIIDQTDGAPPRHVEDALRKFYHDNNIKPDSILRPAFTDPMAKIEKAAKEFQKEQDKEIGITREETPEQKAQAEGEELLNEEPLTEEDINNSHLSAVQKTWAKAYLNGKTDNELYLEAYLEAKEDVRNRRQDNEANRSDAGSGTQLAGPDDNGERRPDGTGTPVVGVDAGADVSTEGSKRPDTGRVSGVEDSKDDVPGTDGKRGDNRISGSEPQLDGLSPRGKESEGSSPAGSGGRDVRRPGGDRQGDGLAEQSGTRDIKTRRTELKNKRDDLLAKLKALKEQEKKRKSGELMMAVLPPVPSGVSSYIPKDKEQRAVFWELATTTAEYGYTYLEEGITKFNEWKDKVYGDFVEPIKDFFGWGQNEVDHYIEQVWNSDYEINGVTRTMSEWASLLGEKQLKKVVGKTLSEKRAAQESAEGIAVKTGDIDNIRETLPYLLPEQQDDVLKAETQFFDESHQDRTHGNGKGIMFTNGTGTGKTYTGLGIVKRFVKQGKGRVLIITPSQEKVTDWANDGLNLGLQIEKLDDVAKATGTTATKSKGKGVVVTTYANARQNLALLEDCFDLIVYDESHKITEGKEAAEGEMYKFHQMLTNKDVEKSIDRQTYWLPEWIEYRNLVKEREENREKLDTLDNYDASETVKVNGEDVNVGELRSKLNARMVAIENRFEELRPIMQEIRESKREQAEKDTKVTKTVFLSATPFNRRENLKYAEGYLFSYPEEDMETKGTYNHRSPEDAFLEQMFPAGYRWRYGRLENHVSNLEALGRQEIDFSDYLQNQLGTMSGRMISSDYDYSRDFPVLTLDNAGRFNQAMSEVYRNRKYQPLAEIMRKIWNYNDATSLFEAMKTSLVNDRIKEHLARGQKVVVFHRRRTSRDIAYPFTRAMDAARDAAAAEPDKNTKEKLLQAVKDFERDFRDIFDWEKTIDYTLPREQIEKRFGKNKVAFFSGAETKNAKHKSVEEFMKDNGGKDIIVIQEASGKEGISLHDQTGEHQRVEINLALPQSPIAFIQIEGRIYRIGQKSNAIFEYPLLGLDLETNLFAQEFNSALGTTENLALGSKARNLRKSIANSILENTGEVDYDRQGLGGKDMDGRVAGSDGKDGFDVSIQDYYGNQKMQRGRDNREGVDYFPTPEPIGYKMVEWAQMLDGETALEPSAGHGAIARYVPETNGMTAIEPSASLFTKLQMRAGGPGRRFEEMTFEDYPLANKHDVILMNPPYGVGGKTAMEHVAKAFRHLNEGGRIIAIIPDGPSMERRLDAWLANPEANASGTVANKSAVVVGEVKLPSVAFGRAGTSVRTRVVVIDKVSRAEMRKNVPEKVTVDLSNEDTIGGLFDRIRNVRMPERTIDQVAINTKKAMRTKSGLEDNPFTRDFEITGNILRIKSKARYGLGDIVIRLDNPDRADILSDYRSVKSILEDPSTLDYGRWAGRTLGKGKTAIPAIDAIKDYCEKVIKTLENVSGMTADQMDKSLREAEEARQRRQQEEQERMERIRQERIEKGRVAIETLKNEFKDDGELPYLISLMTKAHSGGYTSFDAQSLLKKKGVDWQTGKKIATPLSTLRESYNEKMPLDLDTMEKLMDIAVSSIDARRKDAARRALEMSGIHSDTGKEKENFDYSSHDEYYEKELREFLETASPFARLETKQQRKEAAEKAPAKAETTVAGYEYKLDKNTRTGADMHLVTMNNRLSDADYKAVERKAKANGGYYNRFKKAWHFTTEEDARKFMGDVNVSNGNDGSTTTRFRKREAQNPVEADFERKRLAGEKVAKSLNMDFEAITDIRQVKNKEALAAIRAGQEVPGWTEIDKNGKTKIFLYLPHVRDTYDAEKTIAHETVGHHGLRALLGEEGYKDYMRSLLFDLKDEGLKKYWIENVSKNGFDTYRTIDEYLAEAAEKGYGDLSMWQKVKEKFTDALRKRGFLMSPSISDVKYMVWLSKHNLEKGNTMDDIRRAALQHRLERERYEAKVRNGEYTDAATETQQTVRNDVPYFPGEGKTLFRHTPSVKNQRQNYERSLHRLGYVWKESHVDAMQSAVELVRAMTGLKKIEDLPSSENFILLENQMSSKEEQMDFLFNRDYMKPLDEAVGECLPDMGSDIDSQLRNLQLYMIKKHGLERNRVLYVRDLIRALRNDPSADQDQVDTMEQDYYTTMNNLRDDLKNGVINLTEYFEETDRWIQSNLDAQYKAGGKDYSGLTELYGKKYKESDIIDEVMSTESMLGDSRVKNLWEKTKAVSQFGLDMEYEGGLDSKEKHDKVSDMFEWYVPLRGYDEKTAEEVYDYLEEHDNGRKWAGPVLMNAKGRKSLSDVDVFATLGSMNSYAINRALNNQMKQAFARFVRNHYKDVDAGDRLVTELPFLWAEKQYDSAGNEIWVEKFPDIPENATADDIAAILDQYQQDMKAKQATGDAKRIRQKSNIPYRNTSPENKSQHIVDVWINGEKHAFIVNGNPRAAQAINGQLKAERNSNILWMSSLSHFMAKMNTSYSPDFIVRNTERDLIYSAANIAVKENAGYWFKWAKNYAVATGRAAFGVPAMHTNLFNRYRKGELNMNNETDRYFKEFMENGGETGWVERKNLDKWKKAIKEGVQQKKLTPEKVGDALLLELRPAIEAMNERAENLARFATYMTSRQSGRSITRSVSDAKEVSVNFNRKGSGKKTAGIYKHEDGWFDSANAYLAGWSAQHFQDYIMFYNAGVQGLNNMVKNVRNNPIKGSTAFAAFAMAAMLMPQLNKYLSEEDDDKDKNVAENPYAELPEWVRRNNICIYTNNGTFATIALPIELRAMYGIGDMAASFLSNPELRSTKNMGEDIVAQLSQVMPINFLEGGEFSLWNMAPSGSVPFLEAYRNKNWLGQPIEREETRWNQNKPRWTRAFKNVSDVYVGASKRMNAATNPYGDENIKGWIDGALTDPALVEHVVNGYFGGVGSTVNRVAQLAKNAKDMSGEEIISSNWTPIARTMHYTPTERTRFARTRNKWWYYKEEMDKTQETIKALKEQGKKDPVSFMKSVSEEEGKKGSRAKIMKKAYKSYDKIKKRLDKTDDLQQKNIYQLELDKLMEETVKELDKIQ